MISIKDFKKRCLTDGVDNIVDEVILANGAVHVSDKDCQFILSRVAGKFSIAVSDLSLYVVGSAKLGYSISQKKKDGVDYPRYRLYSPTSDIDTAIVSPVLFRILWEELGLYSHGMSYFPWNSGALGDYMICGWLRPDHFPRHQRLTKCDDWGDLFRRMSLDSRFKRHAVRGGLFYSLEDLRRYHRRSVSECIRELQGPP